MRLILEKHEIIAILGKHFDTDLDPENVIIRTDPLEIEVRGLPLATSDSPPKEENNVEELRPKLRKVPEEEVERPKKVRADEDATTDPPPPGSDGVAGSDDVIHPASVLAASKQLERQLDQENPKSARRSGRWSEIAPATQDDEI